ncbi:hypothetical protein V5F81_21210 [Xanthobacter autotrophicus]|uniref:hypothetical protein n=1 Tax=Xanthobacter autotrophicus TaxID=280 RepID=UPI0037294933
MPGSEVGVHELSILMCSADQVRGSDPRAKVSMMVMMPPQQRQRGAALSLSSSAEGTACCAVSASTPSSARILSMLAARTALANRP